MYHHVSVGSGLYVLIWEFVEKQYFVTNKRIIFWKIRWQHYQSHFVPYACYYAVPRTIDGHDQTRPRFSCDNGDNFFLMIQIPIIYSNLNVQLLPADNSNSAAHDFTISSSSSSSMFSGLGAPFTTDYNMKFFNEYFCHFHFPLNHSWIALPCKI